MSVGDVKGNVGIEDIEDTKNHRTSRESDKMSDLSSKLFKIQLHRILTTV